MSSQPPERKEPRFDTWRKLMLAGALLMLVATVKLGSTQPEPLWYRITTIVAYVLLALGFAMAMRRRRELAEERRRKLSTEVHEPGDKG